jgi:ketosteroid isomerase-like protein
MSAKVRALISVSLALVGTALVRISHAQPSTESDKSDIMALNQRLYAAFDRKDLAATMACFSNDPDAIFFEPELPFEMNKATLSNAIEILFKSVSDLHSRIEAVNVQVSGDLAAAHLIQRNTWTDQTGTHSQTNRYTQVDRGEGGKWLIWHEHLSVPFDLTNGKAVLNAKP